jgi:pimeloyl-ACP methyl ester carboxylesterase
VTIHTQACRATRFRSKQISRAGGLQEALARFAGPILMIWGEKDVTMSPESIAAIVHSARDGAPAGAPAVTVRIVPNAGHWVQYEAHQSVNALLHAWLRPAHGDLNQAGPRPTEE